MKMVMVSLKHVSELQWMLGAGAVHFCAWSSIAPKKDIQRSSYPELSFDFFL